ncbi:hypothetical protein [Flavobacterium sp. HJSW_4]|uniref:hypothetical protein n=1 Tax=Flavobacterium sp. HJSW_4 TaxID=3344660 RepID=UPI0035F33347
MSEVLNVFNAYNNFTKSLLISIIVMFCFWTVPFCIFKPEIFAFPFYMQIGLVVALTILWFIVVSILSIPILAYVDAEQEAIILIPSFFAMFYLNISIVVSYYYSNSFTYFLRVAVAIALLGFIIKLCVVGLLYRYTKKK